MKTIIHLQSTRDKYPWLESVLSNEETYMEMAGLLGGSSSASIGGKPIPAVLQNHTDLSAAYPIDSNTFTLDFDPSGADRDFIQKVPLKFSPDGGSFEAAPPDGWAYQKTDTSIIFSNPNPQPPGLFVQFDPTGTEYQTGGGYASVQEVYDKVLQLWVCIECNDRHIYHSQKKLPLEAHQRLVYLYLNPLPEMYFASINRDSAVGSGESGSVQFQVYRHEEDMESTYNVQLYKYDHETGNPLENSVFKLYERFDDQGEIDKERDGPVHIYEGGEPYKSYHTDNPATWDGFRFVTGLSTDENGYASKTVNHGYHYDKTFCDGHPAPRFVPVPEEEEEEDEESGEAAIANEGEIEAAQAENRRLAQSWLACYADCEAHAGGDFEGVHFHWMMPEADRGEIESILDSGGSPGETPNAGKTVSASGEESYRESGCEEDCRQTYDKFISLRYSYAFTESRARDGYIRHGIHTDDLPIEVITTDSSENGANAVFAGEYSTDIDRNDTVNYALAEETLAARERIAGYQRSPEESGLPNDIRLTQKPKSRRQEIVRYLAPDKATASNADTETMDETELIDDVNGVVTTPSNCDAATPSNAPYRFGEAILKSDNPVRISEESHGGEDISGGSGGVLFQDAYRTAVNGSSSGAGVEAGPDGNYSHCNDRDGEGNAWRIYDHRTEGEIHINKQDMELEDGKNPDYDSYGDTQGDGALEGAVYGLFAAEDLIHPDGKTGVVYRANNLVAVASTDRNGEASFMASTEPPGYQYHYESGKTVQTDDGWAEAAPQNLYVDSLAYDDYSVDSEYGRAYPDNQEQNGSCWVGRPLLLGSYYIKELNRSEGYELSIGNRGSALTNRGQDCDVALPAGTGYANISRGFYAEGQISSDPTGDFGDPDIDELFFTAESKGTAGKGFDIVLDNIPAGARIYRLDTGKELKEIETGTGIYDKVYLTKEDGAPDYAVAENDYQYPKYNPDGSLLTVDTPVSYRADWIPAMPEKPLDDEKVQRAIAASEPELTKEQVAAKLGSVFSIDDFHFLKAKTERALRANGRRTPYIQNDGTTTYSSISEGIYNRGVRKGEVDENGISGSAPGEPASDTVYGAPLVTLEIPAYHEDGSPLSTGDLILTILGYYGRSSFYSFGGVHEITREDGTGGTGGRYNVAVYASCHGSPADFVAPKNGVAGEGTIFHRVPYMPDDSGESPRYLYAAYSNDPASGAFGSYEDFSGQMAGGTYFASATLITDAAAQGDGTLVSKTVKQNVYYQAGEIPRDAAGKQIQAFEYKERTVRTAQEVEARVWTELFPQRKRRAATQAGRGEEDGKIAVHIDSSYTDHYGREHGDTELQAYSLRVVLPQKEITLTQDDIGNLQSPAGWLPGETMGSACYYLNVRRAKAKACLDYQDASITGDGSYVKRADLAYPGQDDVWQDGDGLPGTNTRKNPIGVQERAVKQKIKITKTIDRASYQDVNTYAEVHEDWFTRLFGSKGKEAGKAGNFRFKIYLKSNLERLYRDEEGRVAWIDRNGNPVDILSYRSSFPQAVQKIYTKVPHSPDIRKNSKEAVTANQELYSFSGGLVHETPNPGYTSILETAGRMAQSDEGLLRVIPVPNYEKLFDGIRTANTDRWDNPQARDRAFTGWAEWDAVRNPWEGETDPAVRDTSYKPFARVRPGVYSASGQSKSRYPAVLDGAETKNEKNTGAAAKKNAMSSDAVRQFAITWYLDDEVKKLVKETGGGGTKGNSGPVEYPDEIYDKALSKALDKASHYLTPFFLYDLDSIYAIEWDGEPDGGKDSDPTTLCADSLQEHTKMEQNGGEDGYYYGISAYLPYGTYVAVEQQPFNHVEGQYDFANRHYQTDAPKEIILPAVYEPGGEKDRPQTLAGRYRYQSTMTPEEMAAAYQIRFQEEWADNHTDDIRGYVIRAHNASGDFEVYKYGLDIARLTGTVGGRPYAGWKVAQDTYDPIKDYYNDPLVDTKEEGGHPDSHYYADDQELPDTFLGYAADGIERYYHYASVSEHAARLDGVRLPCEKQWEGTCAYGEHFRDDVAAMEGEQMAYEGFYAPMLVPWTVREPAGGGDYAGGIFRGYAEQGFQNTFYSANLRIEKLDSETGESILHDEALFAIYAAERDDSETGEGLVKFYDKPTVISGSRQFLEAMGAVDIETRARRIPDPDLQKDALWYGTVPEGTPVCKESGQIVLRDENGNKTGQFRAFSTMRDGTMMPEPDGTEPLAGGTEPSSGRRLPRLNDAAAADQNTGYLKLPQPLGAGVYVLAEIRPPSGYMRSRPIAVEVYSDRVTYYLDGNREKRVAAAICGTEKDGGQARVYVGNTPVRLEVSKKKTDEKTVTYRVSGRVEGSVTELNGRYGLENLELAYNASGTYLGYGWKKGTAETLAARKASGEAVEIFYENGVFSGYADITRPLLTAGDKGRYVAGAVLTLYDAIPVRRNGDSQDYAYDGVVVERDRNSNVTRMYVRQGYAGTKTELICGPDGSGDVAAEGAGSRDGVWACQAVRRPDTDILYYDLGNLDVFTRDGSGALWSYDREGKPVRVRSGVTESIYALQDSRPVFEIAGGDFSALQYDPMAKAFTETSADTIIYHLDENGQRDAMVDGYTGMAYLVQADTGQEERQGKGPGAGLESGQRAAVMVWPVNVIKDGDGSVLAKHKIKTSRIASVHADTEWEYMTGTYDGAGGGSFLKRLNPVYDRHGQVEYYQRSDEGYRKSGPVRDRDGDFIYDRYSDHLTRFNNDAYTVKARDSVFDKGRLWDESDNRDEKLYMREGDNYILENTWLSGDKTPNDPFDSGPAAGQADMLKRVIPGFYIMEELKPPKGYARAFPVCVEVKENDSVQRAEMADETIKVEISKVDAPDGFRQRGIDYDGIRTVKGSVAKTLSRTEPKGAYSYLPVAGAELALYRAKKVPSADYETFPDGWYFIKTETQPASWTVTDENNVPATFTASWTSTGQPFYMEGIPAGNYILEELKAPAGYVRSTAWLEVRESGEVQVFQINNDHTKLEIFKYQEKDGKKTALPNTHAARLGLYPAVTDGNGRPVMEDGSPLYWEETPVEIWKTDDCRQYTALTDLSLYDKWGIWTWVKSLFGGGRSRYSGFEHDYEKMYREYGAGFDELHWYYTDEPGKTGTLPNLREGIARLETSQEAGRSGCVTQLWSLGDGRQIRITVSPEPNPLSGGAFTFGYQYHYRRLAGNMVSYDTSEGCHRIDYIPSNGESAQGEDGHGAAYVLAEIAAPEGYQPAKPKLVMVHETADIQMYAMENRPEPDRPKPPPEETKPEETSPPETPGETETTAPPTKPEPPETPDTPDTPGGQDTTSPPETPKPSRPDGGEEPPTMPERNVPPSPVPLVGKITAKYEGGRRNGVGRQVWYREYLSRTGDVFPLWLWMTLFSVSGVGVLIVARRKKDEGKKKTRGNPSGGCGMDGTGENPSDRAVDAGGPASDGNGKMP